MLLVKFLSVGSVKSMTLSNIQIPKLLGDTVRLRWTPTNYTPAVVSGYSSLTTELTSHLNGVDTKLGAIPASSLVAGTIGAGAWIVPAKTDGVAFTINGTNTSTVSASELCTNGSFTVNTTGWILGTGWTHDAINGEVDHTPGNTAFLTWDTSIASYYTLRVVFTIKNRSAGSVDCIMSYNGVLDTIGGTYSTSGTYTCYVPYTDSSDRFAFAPTSDFDGSIDDVSLKLITQVNPIFSIGGTEFFNPGNTNFSIGTGSFKHKGAGSYNVAVGEGSQRYNYSGSGNTSLGVFSMLSLSSGLNNVALGYHALGYCRGATSTCVAIGAYSEQKFRGTSTVAIGEQSCRYGYGRSNVFIGNTAGFGVDSITNTSNYNVGIGTECLYSINGAIETVAIGNQSLSSITSGYYNTAIGNLTGAYLDTGESNTLIGRKAGYYLSGSYNVAIGRGALTGTSGQSSGGYNVSLGYYSGYGLTTGTYNIFLGTNAGYSETSNSNRFVVSNSSSVNFIYGVIDNSGTTGSLTVRSSILPSATTTYNLGSATYSWNDIYSHDGGVHVSDGTKKDQITDSSLGLDFIDRLRPVSYKWKDTEYEETYEISPPESETYEELEEFILTPAQYDEENNLISEAIYDTRTVTKTRHIPPVTGTRTVTQSFTRKHYGLISQEVKSVLDDLEISTVDFAGYIDSNGEKGLRYNEFIAPMIKAIQELNQKVESLL